MFSLNTHPRPHIPFPLPHTSSHATQRKASRSKTHLKCVRGFRGFQFYLVFSLQTADAESDSDDDGGWVCGEGDGVGDAHGGVVVCDDDVDDNSGLRIARRSGLCLWMQMLEKEEMAFLLISFLGVACLFVLLL